MSLTPTNTLQSTSYIMVQLPTLRYWINNINTNDKIPLSSSGMVCNNQSSNVNSNPTCTGDVGNYILYVTNVFSTTVSSAFSFGVTNSKSPPTL